MVPDLEVGVCLVVQVLVVVIVRALGLVVLPILHLVEEEEVTTTDLLQPVVTIMVPTGHHQQGLIHLLWCSHHLQ